MKGENSANLAQKYISSKPMNLNSNLLKNKTLQIVPQMTRIQMDSNVTGVNPTILQTLKTWANDQFIPIRSHFAGGGTTTKVFGMNKTQNPATTQIVQTQNPRTAVKSPKPYKQYLFF